MEVFLTFKTPDVVRNSIPNDATEEERKEVTDFFNNFVQYGEILRLFVNTQTREISIIGIPQERGEEFYLPIVTKFKAP